MGVTKMIANSLVVGKLAFQQKGVISGTLAGTVTVAAMYSSDGDGGQHGPHRPVQHGRDRDRRGRPLVGVSDHHDLVGACL